MNTDIVDLDEVVGRVHSACLDGVAYKQYHTHGTLDEYYHKILTAAIADVASLPLTRTNEGLEPTLNPIEVSRTFIKVARLLCVTFGKPFAQVETDLVHGLDTFPADDYRTAKVLRSFNKLH